MRKQANMIGSMVVIIVASSAEAAGYSGGAGSAADPYQMATAGDWITLADSTADWNKHFILTGDIDFGGELLTPVGNFPDAFTGTLDGYGHTLSNARIEAPEVFDVGVIGYLGPGGELRNLGVEAIAVEGQQYVGVLVGVNRGTIVACYAKGTVTGNYGVGGLVGSNYYGTITACYARCTVNGTAGSIYVGGLVGVNQNSVISACYAAGPVAGDTYVGGFAGQNGEGEASIDFSYWDKEVSGQSTSDGGEGRSTDAMTYPYALTTYLTWDFMEVWEADILGAVNGGYPYLRAQIPHPADSNKDFQLVMNEAIAYLAGWQQGGNPLANAIRAAYLWQNGEGYLYDKSQVPSLCWILTL